MTRENSDHFIIPTISEKERHSLTKKLHKIEARALRKYKLNYTERRKK